MYMKVITSLCNEDANQQEEQGRHGDFSPEVHVFANMLVPVVLTAHLEVHILIGITSQTLNRVLHNQHKMRVAQWHALLELLFAAPTGRAQVPLTSSSPELRTIF